MELNAAYSRIRLAFRTQPHQPIKIGCKDSGYLELRFITEVVGQRYRDLLGELAREVGYPIHIYPHPDQNALAMTARGMVEEFVQVTRQPSVFVDRQVVMVKLARRVPDTKAVQAHFLTTTGYQLELQAEALG